MKATERVNKKVKQIQKSHVLKIENNRKGEREALNQLCIDVARQKQANLDLLWSDIKRNIRVYHNMMDCKVAYSEQEIESVSNKIDSMGAEYALTLVRQW